ncbi:MAG: VCBS repeat-containing protein, partial [Planctomycetota bacterium]|nr:VCBS repeat-containing protein [Planctomycetota bacterium]
MPRPILLLALPLFAAASSAQVGLERPFPTHTPEAGYLPGSNVAYFVLANPAPAPGARFGSDVCILDFDGDGHRDLAVGVPGEPGAGYAGRVDIFRGPLLTHGWTLTPKDSHPGDLFGYALAAGDLDGDGDEELAVGSPGWDASVTSEQVGRVVVFAHRGAAGPVQLAELRRSVDFPGARLGSDVVVADVLGGPGLEVAAGAPFAVVSPSQFRAGEVLLFESGTWAQTRWPNPQPNSNHDEFGNRLAAVDWDGDGLMDLAVSAIFNWVQPSDPCVLPCVENAGQTFVVLHQSVGAPPRGGAPPDNPRGRGAEQHPTTQTAAGGR